MKYLPFFAVKEREGERGRVYTRKGTKKEEIERFFKIAKGEKNSDEFQSLI